MKIGKDLIDSLESTSSKEEAIFAFCYEEDNQDNEHIKANKDGLKQFASFLLRIAYEQTLEKPTGRTDVFPIDDSLGIPGEGLNVHYVKLLDVKKSEFKVKTKKPHGWKESLFKIGCIGLLVLFVICGLLGAYNLIIWIF